MSINPDDLLAAGTLEIKRLNFSFVNVQYSILPALVATAFGVPQPKAKYLPGYFDARVEILAIPSEWGTVREIIRVFSRTKKMNISNFPQFGVLDDQAYRNYRVIEIAKFLRELSGQRRSIPFDPFLCASYFGIAIKERQLPAGISGRLRVNDSLPEIEVNCADQRLRKRYTVCHELAHLCFQKEIPATPKERAGIDWAALVPTVQKREEVLCNQIAAELLMPANPFRRMAKGLCPNFDGLSALATAFDVSISACLRRVKILAVWSVGTREWQIQKGQVIAQRWPKPTVASRIRRSREIAQVKNRMYRLLSQTEHIIKNKYGGECTSYDKCPWGYQHALVNGSEIHIARIQTVINAFVII